MTSNGFVVFSFVVDLVFSGERDYIMMLFVCCLF